MKAICVTIEQPKAINQKMHVKCSSKAHVSSSVDSEFVCIFNKFK